jgi:hypothetical protein
VRWDRVEDWQAGQDRWDAIRSASRHVRGTAEERASLLVLESLVDWDLAEAGFSQDTGVLLIRDVDALATEIGLDRDLLTG